LSALELTDVVVEYERRGLPPVRAVAGASLEVDRGQIVGLVGESGCGKSTLARAAIGMVAPLSGTIQFEGREVKPLSRGSRPRELARLQMVFQNPFSSLNPRRRVGEQIGDALAVLGLAPRQERPLRIAELLEQVGLPAGAARGYPHEFSGGQRQRIAIARALALEPSLVVANEPVSALDVSVQSQILNLVADLKARLGLSLIFISHDLSVVRHVSDRVAVLYFGRVVEIAAAGELYARPAHPYTQALLAAIPRIGRRRPDQTLVAGELPDPANPPRGCAFAARCPKAMPVCREISPALVGRAVDGGSRAVACHLHPVAR
jgi:oligopeptide/dipeptide ABC transporter ATP-binding protein